MGELVETQAAAAGVTFHRERAGGTISFTSEEGVGTTFTIEFRVCVKFLWGQKNK